MLKNRQTFFFQLDQFQIKKKNFTIYLKYIASLLQPLLFPMKYQPSFPNRHFFSLLSQQLCTVKKMNSLLKYCLLQCTSVKIFRPYFIKYLSHHHYQRRNKKVLLPRGLQAQMPFTNGDVCEVKH